MLPVAFPVLLLLGALRIDCADYHQRCDIDRHKAIYRHGEDQTRPGDVHNGTGK